MKTLPQKYDTQETETRLQTRWSNDGTYHWDESLPRDANYVIDTPPPTVSGLLHMGHIFSYTQADFVARYQRMQGKNVFYPMGFDDNGLPTERLVEKSTKKRAVDFDSREAFIEACMQVSEEARKDFRDLFESVALSVDWRQEYHTISERSRKLSQMSFLDLHNKGEVERRLEPMFWDPIDQTAIAQAEIEDKEMQSHFNDITFSVDGSDETFVIGTTRPELIPACVAIFYHPDDARYQHLKGKQAVTPLFGIKVPILEDDTVEPDKGTGIMMCCTFGDEADIDKWRRHTLDTRIILNKYGKLNFVPKMYLGSKEITELEQLFTLKFTDGFVENYRNERNKILAFDVRFNNPTANKAFELLSSFQDLKAKVAREKIVELLRESGDLVESKPHTHAVKCAERSGAALEILPTYQWFVKVMDKKDVLKARSAECNWHPEWMAKRMEQWIDGLSWDWCISRQRYFGVPFPLWYSKRAGEEGKILLAEQDQLPCNPLTDLPKGYTADEVTPEADVMDTWATSSISPQLSSHGISAELTLDADRHSKLYPADLRPQAHEIIRTWAFYTLVKSHLHNDVAPWKNLMISGWCLAEDKQKMSKSKGNVVTPVDLIREQGADVVRYWASTSKLGTDTAFSRDLLKIGKKLVNKLWNATKFAAIHLEKLDGKPAPTTAVGDIQAGHITETLDKWILTRLNRAISKSTESFEAYEYSKAREAMEDFFWNDLCDNYLELVKRRAYNEDGSEAEGQTSAVYTIYHCLDGILRLFAPIVPHVTEELWTHIFEQKAEAAGSLHSNNQWPNAGNYPQDSTAEEAGIATVELLEAVRKAKSERNVSIKWPVTEAAINPRNKQAPALDASAQRDLCAAGNIIRLQWHDPDGRIVANTPIDTPQQAGDTPQPAASDSAQLISDAENYALTLLFAAEASAA